MIDEAIKIVQGGADLSEKQMSCVMEEILTGRALTAQIVSFLCVLNDKGESIEEVSAAVKVMRTHATQVHTKQDVILDTCGTGGDSKETFNISTTVAFVAAASGVAVAKHGNRSVSSASGSADILEALGVNINLSKEKLGECLDQAGIAFLFAQSLHPAMKYAMEARKKIGRRTIFNIIGPLSNPAHATHQLVGVFAAHWVSFLAQVLARLGTRHALVVHGQDGLDEVTTTAKTMISEVKDGKVRNYEIFPDEFGIKKARLEDLSGASPRENALILLDILKGKKSAGRDIVILNSAAAIYAADKVKSIKEGIIAAEEAIDSGKALEKLEMLKEFTSRN
ncbi:MAG: anthranilate phosphoribosyltransferase [Candidatus Omnitrophota bacterium]|jgi:anthranilate phosphoribosyltransferase